MNDTPRSRLPTRRRRVSARRAIGFWVAIGMVTVGVVETSDLVVRRSADRLVQVLSPRSDDQGHAARR